ncbi:MAG: DUF938 domain-containing protein [Gammaproteobacteria bacterium]|nr:DUF938 domain-containing protein [Gammaproteobacteria bacterium]MDP7455234.1 DUF938 domain-containing protein [Gammaproteobacteria bacterium]
MLEVLKKHLSGPERLLEIGGGTGQHAVYFAQNLPHLHWQSTDIAANVDMLNRRILLSGLSNLPAAAGFHLLEDNDMPANNQMLVWKKAPQ